MIYRCLNLFMLLELLIIEEEHAREMPDTSLIIRDVVRMSDGAVAMRDNMTKEELV